VFAGFSGCMYSLRKAASIYSALRRESPKHMMRKGNTVKKLSVSFVVAIAMLQSTYAQVQGLWVSTGTMQSGREYNALVRMTGGKALSVGGADNTGTILNSAEIYTASTGKWTATGGMAEARELFAAVALASGKILVSGGEGIGSVILSSAELYDPTTGAWSSAGSLSVARAAHTATLLPNGKVLVAGGCTTTGCTATAVSELYDPTTNSWTTTGNLNTARGFQTAVLLKTGNVLVIGGSPGLTSCELYSPATGAWTVAASTTVGRYLHTTTLLSDGKVLVAGGANGRFPISSAEVYDPAANTWTATGSMVSGRYAHTAALLGDGTVSVAGGYGQSISCGKACTGYIPFAKAEIYNEAAGKFTAAASLPQALAHHSTVVLTNGRVLEAGGIGTTAVCCVVESTASLYAPLTLSYSSYSLNFGLLQIGLSSPTQTVTVTNLSSRAETFASIASSGDYSQTNTCPIAPATLAAGLNCTVTITFTPTVMGNRKGAVTVKDNSPGNGTQTISLTGTGETLALGFTPGSLSLGSVAVGSSIAMSATLTNDGAASVNLTGFAITPANSTYAQTNNCPASLGVQQTCMFQIAFTPPDVFTYKATLSVMNSAGSAPSLALTGTGLDGP
jgi:Galactose oxidase, central domain/Kelch motif